MNISGEADFKDKDAGTQTSTTSANTTSTGGAIGDGYSISTRAQSNDGQTTQLKSPHAEYSPMVDRLRHHVLISSVKCSGHL